jgi:hypothetical protein
MWGKKVASGADRAAEQAKAQGHPGTGTCAPNCDMRPELDRLSWSKNLPYHNQLLGTSSVGESDVGRFFGVFAGQFWRATLVLKFCLNFF